MSTERQPRQPQPPGDRVAPTPSRRHAERSGLAGLALLVVYVVVRLTRLGSNADQSVRGDPNGSGLVFALAHDLLGMVTPASVTVVSLGVAALAWRRRGGLVAARTLVVVGLAPAVAEVLKSALPTWSHGANDHLVWGGSFPSGHVAVTSALALALLTALSRATPAVVLRGLAIALPVAVAVSVVVVGWHDPSDTVGGALVALAVHHGLLSLTSRHASRRVGRTTAASTRGGSPRARVGRHPGSRP